MPAPIKPTVTCSFGDAELRVAGAPNATPVAAAPATDRPMNSRRVILDCGIWYLLNSNQVRGTSDEMLQGLVDELLRPGVGFTLPFPFH